MNYHKQEHAEREKKRRGKIKLLQVVQQENILIFLFGEDMQ